MLDIAIPFWHCRLLELKMLPAMKRCNMAHGLKNDFIFRRLSSLPPVLARYAGNHKAENSVHYL